MLCEHADRDEHGRILCDLADYCGHVYYCPQNREWVLRIPQARKCKLRKGQKDGK